MREGRYVNADDIRLLLKDDKYVDSDLVPLLRVGLDKGDSITDVVRAVAGAPIYDALKGVGS
jgi:hypothetical protein